MSDGTKIEWTDATLNVVNGCSVVSPGCTNCYAMRSGGRNLPHHPATGLTKPSKAGHVWTGEVRFNEKALMLPLRWKRPRKIFWNAHGDLFHDKVPDEWVDRCFAIMALTPHHIHQVLTKRPERMREYLTTPADHDGRGREIEVYEQWRLMREQWAEALPWDREWDWRFRDAQGLGSCNPQWPLPNVWLGVSVEDQQRADERIPILLDTPAARRWLSCEPLLGPVNLRAFGLDVHHHPANLVDHPSMPALLRAARAKLGIISPDWIVAGGESGPGARPMHPDWARSLRDQCAAAGVPFLFKQWGDWHPDCFCDRPTAHRDIKRPEPGKPGCMFKCGKSAGRLLDGVQHDGYPA